MLLSVEWTRPSAQLQPPWSTSRCGDSLGSFITNSSRKALSKQRFVTQIRDILNSLGLQQDQYAGHSFRIGAATTVATVGIQDSTIQTLGRWHSAAFLQYIRTPQGTIGIIIITAGLFITNRSHELTLVSYMLRDSIYVSLHQRS